MDSFPTSITQHSYFEIHRGATCNRGSFLSVGEWHFVVWIYHNLFIHSPVGHLDLGCFHLGAIVNELDISSEQVIVWTCAFISGENT